MIKEVLLVGGSNLSVQPKWDRRQEFIENPSTLICPCGKKIVVKGRKGGFVMRKVNVVLFPKSNGIPSVKCGGCGRFLKVPWLKGE